jgi:glycerol dehydrogenase
MATVLKPTRAWGSPGRYIQGPNELLNLHQFTQLYGSSVYAIIDQYFFETLTKQLKDIYSKTDSTIETTIFNTEVTEQLIAKTTEKATCFQPSVIVGIGGGKTLDTAKAVADDLKLPVIIVPTSASTDAPTSALSVLYKENGEHSHARHYHKSPELVLLDSVIISRAPVRFLVSGMGDALSTVFEAKANQASDSPNYIAGGYRQTATALAVANACYRTLIEKGLQAKLAVENNIVTEALEDIIEVNTLMSGLGFENTGCAGAHSVGDGVTALPAGKLTLHGEKVAFGVICQLVAENAPMAVIDEVVRFCLQVGLPVTLEDLKVDKTTENLRTMAACSMHSFWGAEPFFVSEDQVMDIYLAGDAVGRYYKQLLAKQAGGQS